MTGIELIAKERKEQIEKHGYTVEHDKRFNPKDELLQAAFGLLYGGNWPDNWDEELITKMEAKPLNERVVIVGAWMAAWCDNHAHLFPPTE